MGYDGLRECLIKSLLLSLIPKENLDDTSQIASIDKCIKSMNTVLGKEETQDILRYIKNELERKE